MTHKELIKSLETKLKEFEQKTYYTGETRIDLMIKDVISALKTQQAELDLYNETEIALNNRIMDLEKEIEEYKKDSKKIYAKYFNARKCIDKLNIELEENNKALDIFDERKYRKRYLEEEREKRPNLLYPDADEIYQRYFEQREELEKKSRQLKIKDEYMKLIGYIACDYDGCNTVKSLQELIDELLEYMNKAIHCDDKFQAYIGGNGKSYNILHEELKEEKQNKV